ncbi:hypothetical protein QFC20_006890 [Naganishia adeliensis]|uniref:Uncharacterized protein n=1 Tax=Naganishia adeliensis TaxID=92952 RepID=A0ACC2V4U9_9TREE|nr:hypothetical protein QFC20_006890 [Naganishia adeliensis]
MSRTPSLRVEDASKNNYPSVSSNGPMSFHQAGFPENHPQYQRPSATPVQGSHHWPPSDGPVIVHVAIVTFRGYDENSFLARSTTASSCAAQLAERIPRLKLERSDPS